MIDVEHLGRVTRIALRSGKDGNPVSRAMLRDLKTALGAIPLETGILVIGGDGLDLTVGRDRTEPKAADPFANFALVTAVNDALAAFPGIVIAVARGRTHGLGVGLLTRADLALAAASTHFCIDEVKLGIPPMFVMERMLRHLPPKQALDLVLSGREFTAAEALAMGLVSRVAPDEALDREVDALVEELATRDPRVLQAVKRYLADVEDMPKAYGSAFAIMEQLRFSQG